MTYEILFCYFQCIDYHFNQQDPSFYTLQAFVQKRDATLDKIIKTLKDIERFDIINIMHSDFSRLADDVIISRSNRLGDESGFSSMQSDTSDFDSGENSFNQNYIFRPAFLPEVADVLQESRPIRELEVTNTMVESDSMNSRMKTERYQTRSAVEKREANPPNKYCKTVMLTFATDGVEMAREVANIFRREKESEQRVGVVILNDHLRLVNANPQSFIFSCFDQVDYVVPIITEGYLKAVSPSNSDTCQSSLHSIDPKFVKYIYTLMNTNYLQKDCLNDKVRCLIPDQSIHMTSQKGLFRGPLFQAWYKLSDVAELKQRMLESNI